MVWVKQIAAQICQTIRCQKMQKSPETLRFPDKSGKFAARGYHAPCFAGMVHFCGVRPDAPGQWGQAGQNAEHSSGSFLSAVPFFLSARGYLSANYIRYVS